ncbi:MAG: nitronate monooxygenase, partial [Pseudomonadota bacterium]|nr:nitronate monooxygenase [Pseudomonadota bacterium]
ITRALAEPGPRAAAPFGVNLIVHHTNPLLDRHVDLCIKHRVPIVITSLGCRPEVNDAITAYGGIVLHDVTTMEHAKKALDRGASGLIAVANGAGGHAGRLSPIAFVEDIRRIWNGPLVLSGAMSSGRDLVAAHALGADMGYMGTRFIASSDSDAPDAYRQMLLTAEAADIVYTDRVSGTHANFLAQSLTRAGIPLDGGPVEEKIAMMDEAKAWRDIWSAGHGVGPIQSIQTTETIVADLEREYHAALDRIAALRH